MTVRVGLHRRAEFDRARAQGAVVGRIEQTLIKHRDIGGGRERAAAGAARASLGGQIEVQDRLREDLAAIDRQRLFGVDDRGGSLVLVVGQPDKQVVHTHRVEQVRAQPVAEVLAGFLADDLGQHPMGGGCVVLPLGVWGPVQSPTHHPPQPGLAVFPETGMHGRVRESAGVQHHLANRDIGIRRLAAALCAPTGNNVDNSLVKIEQTLVQQLPDSNTDHSLGCGEHAKEGVVAGGLYRETLMRLAEAAHCGEFTVVADGDLGGRHLALRDDPFDVAEQLLQLVLVNRRHVANSLSTLVCQV